MEPVEEALDDAFCPRYHYAVELVGKKWNGAILRALLQGLTRFRDLRAAIPHLSDRMLSERLKQLEAEGLVERSVVPETPVRVEYRLTERGQALEQVVAALQRWADEWVTLEQATDDRAS